MNVKLMLLLLVCVWLSHAQNNANGGDAVASGSGSTATGGTSAGNQQFLASIFGQNSANGGKATASGSLSTATGGNSLGNIQSIGCTQHCWNWPGNPPWCPNNLPCIANCCY